MLDSLRIVERCVCCEGRAMLIPFRRHETGWYPGTNSGVAQNTIRVLVRIFVRVSSARVSDFADSYEYSFEYEDEYSY
eukprot:scaffold373558_cov15-Prasinocladus_malaysianus.AAC.1